MLLIETHRTPTTVVFLCYYNKATDVYRLHEITQYNRYNKKTA